MLNQEQRKFLNSDLPASAVMSRQGKGGSEDLQYVSGFYVFDTLNEVFGPGSWGISSVELTKVSEDKSEKGSPRVAYLARVVLHIEGIEGNRETGGYFEWRSTDVGYGSGVDKDPGAAHEKAAKEAVTDGVKRCARALGRRMGLALYDKSQAHVAGPEMEFVELFSCAETAADYAAACDKAAAVVKSLDAIPRARLKAARMEAAERLGVAA